MFTGLIADLGSVQQIERDKDGAVLAISSRLAGELSEGDSVAVNGVCLTVVNPRPNSFSADLAPETLRLSNLGDLRRTVESLTSRGVEVEFIKEGMVFNGDDTPMSKFMLNIMGSFAELERSMILERQREGVALAKKAGRYKGRAPAIRSNNGKLAELERLYILSTPVAEMARQTKVSRQTIYSWLKTKQERQAAA